MGSPYRQSEVSRVLSLGLSEEPHAPEFTLAPASNSHWSPGIQAPLALQHWQGLPASLLKILLGLQVPSLTTTNSPTPHIASAGSSCFQPVGGAGFPQLPPSVSSAWASSGCSSHQSQEPPPVGWVTCLVVALPQTPISPHQPICFTSSTVLALGSREAESLEYPHRVLRLLWTIDLVLAKKEHKWGMPPFQPHKGYMPEKNLAVYLLGLEAGYPHTAAGLARPARYKALGNRKQRFSVTGIAWKWGCAMHVGPEKML